MLACQTLITQLYHLCLPYTCILCKAPAESHRDLCLACSADLPWLNHACRRCGRELASTQTPLCGQCLLYPPPYQRLFSLWRYEPPLTRLITGVKFYQRYAYLRLLADYLCERMTTIYQNEDQPECLVPVPLHPQRLQHRGFNQAQQLARQCSCNLAIPIANKLCWRTKATPAQALIPWQQRQKNLKHAFSTKSNPPYRHVAVIDDVVTTGATVLHLSQSLRSKGIEKIDIWCCARTQLNPIVK